MLHNWHNLTTNISLVPFKYLKEYVDFSPSYNSENISEIVFLNIEPKH